MPPNRPELFDARHCVAKFVPTATCRRWLEDVFAGDHATVATDQQFLGYTLAACPIFRERFRQRV